ncbi:MAG: bifunctional glutamate N-acetyltransferase/amino-acid acetyltransferase ArgJ [Desulfuromonadaceae bacterium]|nr:bifunctional glutamate N-acetyltransferase/amino-acid acetyltransferase ArgJ [Desulfuromonadaceae bacterium]
MIPVNTHVKGFSFAVANAGIKQSERPDCGLIYSDVPATCAGVFTRNKVVAAPLQITRPRIRAGRCQAVLVNSGNANACTGIQGLETARRNGNTLAAELEIAEDLVALASTGVIGVQLPGERLDAVIPQLVRARSSAKAEEVAKAIMTTDQFSKVSVASLQAAQQHGTILGIAKGAGMIHPNMATMLGFVVTDAKVGAELLQQSLSIAVEQSFNSITVDGDTSTNDMVLVMANGQAEDAEIVPGSAGAEDFQLQLNKVLLDLAKMIVRDGEGATKVVQIHVQGARSATEAKEAARSVATSNLVKTAFFGEDANWGRIIAALGYSDAEVDADKVDIWFDQIQVVSNGLSTGPEQEELATKVLQSKEFCVTLDLHLGQGSSDYYTSDLTYEYVKINADYRT